MSSQYLGKAIVSTIALFALWFTAVAVYKYYGYSSLNSRTMANEVSWSVKEINDEKYFLEAHYRYRIEGKEYTGSSVVSDFPYRNSYAAEQAIKENDAKRWTVWYDKNDNGYSALQKNYPAKDVVYAAIMWGLALYFTWLCNYVAKKQL